MVPVPNDFALAHAAVHMCVVCLSRFVGEDAIAPCSTGTPCHAQLGAEIQIVNIFSQFTGSFTAGEFKLSYNGAKSTCLTAGASAAQVQAALVSIPALAGVSWVLLWALLLLTVIVSNKLPVCC